MNESKRLVRYMNSLETRLENLERNKPQGYSSLDATSILIRDEDGNVTGKIGQLDDGSTGLITIPPDPEVKEPRTLAVPTAPLLDQNVSAVAVTWDGLTVDHAEWPLDFYCLEIHASEEQGFTADDLTLVSALYETEPSSAVVGPILKGTWYFKLRLRARNGEVSEASTETGIEVELDLPTLNGKIENASGGVNYYQPTPPTGEEPYPQASIWFDTSEDPETGLISYKPHHWTEADGWVSLENQRIKAIEEAQADLTATVDELVNSPSGLKIHNSLGDPVSSGDDAEGDIWQKWDTLASGGKLLASWRFESGVWKSQSLAASYLPTVDIGTGTFGNLSGGRLELNSLDADRVLIGGSIGKTLIADGAVQTDHLAAKSITSASGVVGDLSAGNITFGTMSGLRIAAGTIYSTQLNSTAIDGMTITGATIRTSASGARVQMNLSGLSVYNNAGNRTFFADASNGALSIVGTLSTSNPGVPRVRIDNSLWTTGIKDESTDTFVDGAGIRIETAGGAIGGQLYSARYSATSGTSNRVVLTGPNPNSGHLAINQQGTAWIRNVPFDNSSSIEPLGTIQVWGDGTGYSGMVDNSVYERGASKRLISYARVASTRYSVGAPTVSILASDGVDSPNRGSLSFNSSGAFNTSVYDDQEIEAAFYYASPTTRMTQIAASNSAGTFNSKITQYGETGELNLYGKNTIRFDTGSSGDIIGLPIAGGHALVVIDKADTPASVAVTFPAGRFADAPNVSVTAESTVPGKTVTGVGATGITKNGFTAWATRTNTTNTGLQWTAVRGG